MKYDAHYYRMPPFLQRHGVYGLAISLATGLLVLETAWFFFDAAAVTALAWAGWLAAGVCALGLWLSFYLPSRLVRESRLLSKDETGMIPFLAAQWGLSVAMVSVTFFAVFHLLCLHPSSVVPLYHLWGSLYLMALFSAVYVHGLAIYIRYVEYLYVRKEDQPIKILTITVSVAVILLVLALGLFINDLHTLKGLLAAGGSQGWGLHVYVRDLYWMSLMLWAFLWHVVCLADH